MNRKNIICRLCLAAILSLFAASSWAQGVTLMGYIKDAVTFKAVPDVVVTLLREDGSVIKDSLMNIPLDNGTVWVLHGFPRVRQKVVVRVTHPDYDTASITHELKLFGRNTQMNLPDILLHRKPYKTVDLNEVVVRPTKIKMAMHGDTIVYDATAFNLPDGSMLSDLVAQLPGAELKKNGEIFVNGEKIDYLMLNSREFFRGNNEVMLRNLPYYTVQKLKVYHRTTELSAYLGRDAEKKEHVMDVQLKRNYHTGYLGNIEGGIGTEHTWMARTFGLRFSDLSRTTLFGNLNNINDQQQPYGGGDWGGNVPKQGRIKTRRVGGEWSTFSSDDKQKNTLDVNVGWTERNDENRTTAQKFLADGSNTYSRSKGLSRNKVTDLNVRDWFEIQKKWFAHGSAEFTYHKNRQDATNNYVSSATSILMPDTLTMRNGEQYNEGHETQVETQFGLTRKLAWGDEFNASVNYRHQNSEHELFGQNNTIAPELTDYRHDYDKAHQRSNTFGARIDYTIPFINAPALTFSYVPEYTKTHNRDNVYRLDLLDGWGATDKQPLRLLPSSADALIQAVDAENTFDYDNSLTSHRFSVGMVLMKWKDGLYRRLELRLPVTLSHERMDYSRGQLDTLCHRNYTTFAPRLDYECTWQNDAQRFRASTSWNNSPASYLQLLPWRDDRNPLSISEGNPGLKKSWTYNVDAALTLSFPVHKQLLSVSGGANVYGNLLTNGFTYSPETGVYTYRPENINGNWDANVGTTYSFTFDKKERFKLENLAKLTYLHSVDMAAVEAETTNRLRKVNTTLFNEKLTFSYSDDNWLVSVVGGVDLRHTAATTSLNMQDYLYGCSARYTIPHLKTTLSADGNMYVSRGYGSKELNKDDFVLNASVSQPFFKGKLIARLEAFDLLHELSSTQYVVNAQGRTETWNRFLPRYVMLHLTYHWNRNPKKR